MLFGHRVCLLVGLCSSPAFAQKAGETVAVPHETPVVDGDKILQTLRPGTCLNVYDVRGDELWISDVSTGWIAKRQVATLRDAFAFFSKRIQKNAQDADAYVARGNAHILPPVIVDDAMRDYDEALRLDSANRSALTGRGFVFMASNSYKRAQADLDAALRLDPQSVETRLMRGMLFMADDKIEEAIAAFTECLQLNPKYAVGFEIRGHLHLHQWRH